MPSNSTNPPPLKKWPLAVLTAMIISVIGIRIYYAHWPAARVTFTRQNLGLNVLVADTPFHLYQGWSNRQDMGGYDGMLFEFSDLDSHAMVMRGMEFPLDMVWVNNNTIVDIAQNAVPEPSKSESDLRVYSSSLPANRVLELPSGFTRRFGINVGDAVTVSGK